jgi:hypothetical protein
MLRSGLLGALGVGRFSVVRTFVQPVAQLEGLRGAERRARGRALTRREFGPAAGLSTAMAHINGALMVGVLLFAWSLLPDEVVWDLFGLVVPFLDDAADDRGLVLLPLLYVFGFSVVEPLLVAGGFGLYLNRRIDLEGWDIDLAFRRLTRRVRTERARATAAGLLAALLVALAGSSARAQPTCDPADLESASRCIGEVLSDPAFGTTREVTLWLPREVGGGEVLLPDWVARLVAGSLEMVLWLALAVVLVGLVLALLRAPPRRGAPADQPPPRRPDALFGLDLAPAALPDDPLSAARTRFARGDAIAALSLLYRGALVFLVDDRRVEIPPSATELECVRVVRGSDPAREPAFAALTRAWVDARYAHRPPTASVFEELCRSYGPAFSSGRSPGAGQS